MSENMDNRVYIGIDPGKDGALALVWSDDGHAFAVPFDKTAYIEHIQACLYQGFRPFVVVEHVNAMPGQGSVSMFHFGESFGWLQGMLDALKVPYELVRPQKWKREFGCTSDKNTSVSVAKRLFPEVSLFRTERCKKEHDGMAEALLMAEYARRRRTNG